MTTKQLHEEMGKRGYKRKSLITEDTTYIFTKGKKWISILWNTKVDYLIGCSDSALAKQFDTERHNEAYEYILSIA